MEQEELKVSFYLKKSEVNTEGLCPVMARLSVGKYSKTGFSAKMCVAASLWMSGRATVKSAAARETNRQLDEIRATAIGVYEELRAVRNGVTAEDVKCQLLGMASGQQTLMNYFEAFIHGFEQRVGVNRTEGTAQSYRYAYSHLARFLREKLRVSDLPFTALDRSFIDKYDLHLRIVCRLSPGTIILLTTRLNTIVGEAVADGILTANPFAGYEPPRPKRGQKYLTANELKRVMTTPLPNRRLYLVRDMFLFSCYTGIPYGDMCLLSEANIEEAEDGVVWIKSLRKKTGVGFEVPLLDLPLHILDKYRGAAPAGRLLPMPGNDTLNVGLKRIAKACGIDRPLVFHAGRHTYATEVTLSHGVPLETVSRMLGHNQISTTEIYAKVTDDKIDADTKALDHRIAERFSITL